MRFVLLSLMSVACVEPYEDVPIASVTHATTNIVVHQHEADYMSLFRDAGAIADPTEPAPKGISVQEPVVESAPRAQVFIGGGGGGSVTMNNVTINGDVYIGSSPSATIVPRAAPTGATIQACEAYVDRVETCSVRMLGSGETAKRVIDSMEAARRTWRRFADDPRVRDSLADSCTVARRQYDSSTSSYCQDRR